MQHSSIYKYYRYSDIQILQILLFTDIHLYKSILFLFLSNKYLQHANLINLSTRSYLNFIFVLKVEPSLLVQVLILYNIATSLVAIFANLRINVLMMSSVDNITEFFGVFFFVCLFIWLNSPGIYYLLYFLNYLHLSLTFFWLF